MSSDTKGAGSRSSGFTGQSVQKVSAGGASESGWAVSADFVVRISVCFLIVQSKRLPNHMSHLLYVHMYVQ